jgi:hypothetical protein
MGDGVLVSSQPGAHRPLGIILMHLRIAEIDERDGTAVRERRVDGIDLSDGSNHRAD